MAYLKTNTAYQNQDQSKQAVSGAPTNNVGGGQIAGTREAGDDPPVKKKKKRYIYGGTGSRRMWLGNNG